MKTTLQQIRDCSPCHEGWQTLLSSLGKTKADNEELCLLHVLESNGLDDALWCLRALQGYDREKRLYAVWCASQVKHLMTDSRSFNALVVAERFAEGDASREDLEAAGDAAWAAARAAARDAAWAAARDAARDAAGDAAWDAARDAQKSEFIRMVKCINTGERYDINTK